MRTYVLFFAKSQGFRVAKFRRCAPSLWTSEGLEGSAILKARLLLSARGSAGGSIATRRRSVSLLIFVFEEFPGRALRPLQKVMKQVKGGVEKRELKMTKPKQKKRLALPDEIDAPEDLIACRKLITKVGEEEQNEKDTRRNTKERKKH